MSINWEFIAECLRTELADYGGLLHLFQAQQNSLFGRDPEAVLRFASEIEAQARVAADSRPADATLRSLLPLIEADARPLIEALIAEVNLLLHRVRKTCRHNHTLLARAVEMHQETMQHLRPQAFSKTYSPAGRLAVASTQPPVALRAAG
jgi:hypothetical protein